MKASSLLFLVCGAAVMLGLGTLRGSNSSQHVYELRLQEWAAFQADPEWQRVKAESEMNGALVDHIDRYFMDPTSFSALK